jgi:hypothetical protein
MRLSKLRLLTVGILALVVLVLLVVVTIMWIWSSTPIEELPTLFWILYTGIVATWVIATWVIPLLLPRINTNDRRLPSVATSAIFALFAALLVASNLLMMPAWTGGRVLGLTLGAYLLILILSDLMQFYMSKRHNGH